MTRTARSAFPRAVEKDRHTNRTGLSTSIRKDGGGAHNWGNPIQDEQLLEEEAYLDEAGDMEHAHAEDEGLDREVNTTRTGEVVTELGRSRDVVEDMNIKNTRGTSDDELENARKARKGIMHKKNVDLSAIARSSAAASTSPPRGDNFLRRSGKEEKWSLTGATDPIH